MAALTQAAPDAAMKEDSTTLENRSITRELDSLPPELVQAIAKCVLSTGGVATYMDMRAVCPSWRSAIPKPSPTEAIVDPRFRPRQWVMLQGGIGSKDGSVIFLNASTGRFRCLRLTVLRDYILVHDSDGLLVLADRERPHAARLLNPLTGDMLQFAAPIPRENWVLTAITGSEPTLMFFFSTHHGARYSGKYNDIPDYYSLEQLSDAVYCADATSQLRAMKFHDEDKTYFFLENVVIYAGHVFVLSDKGTLYKIVWTGDHWYVEPIIETHMKDSRIYLVVSAGKLLLVKEGPQNVEAFSVDVERKQFEHVENIGSHALFLRCHKCVSVDADKLPSIDGNCIYSAFAGFKRFTREDRYKVLLDGMYDRHDLRNGKKEYISSPQVAELDDDASDDDDGTEIIDEGPFSLAQVLLTPYPKVKAQLDSMYQTEHVRL